MYSQITRFFVIILLLLKTAPIFAQYKAVHEIDSVMDLSPYHLPTYYSKIQFIEFESLKFNPIDTSMTTIHLLDPLLKPENIYQGLGVNGQAHQSVIFDYQREMGFLYQQLPYPLYYKKQSDLTFPKLQTTYSRVAYTLGFPKENQLLANFAKFVKGISIDFNLHAIFNEGFFINHNTRNLCGDILVHYELPSSLYGFKTSFIINHLENSENGGMKDTKAYKENTSDDVLTSNAKSKITIFDFSLQNYVNIISKNKRYFGTFTHDFQLSQTKLSYQDKLFDSLSLPYPQYDPEATNDSTHILVLKNALQWSNFKPYRHLEDKGRFFHIAGGVLHDYAELRYSNDRFNSLYLFARTNIRIFQVIDISAKLSFSFYGYTQNDIFANAGVSWTINREIAHIIGLCANYYRNTPEYIFKHVANNHFRWDTNFTKQSVVQLKAFWNYKKYNASICYYHIDKLVFLSEQLQPIQNQKNGDLIQFSTFIPFQIKNFGTTANLNVQYCSNDVIRVPIFAGKLSVYYVFEFFKKRFKIQVGTDLMYNTPYYADAYLPVLHKFYYQNRQTIGDFIFWDANVTFKIDRINFFFRIANLLPPFMNYNNFTTPSYPVKDYSMSIGINWRFFD